MPYTSHILGSPEKPSHVGRSVHYNAEKQTMIIDFAKREEEGQPRNASKAYLYVEVPEEHFTNIVNARATLNEKGEPGSEGSYILKHIVGKRGTVGPYKFKPLIPGEMEDLLREGT